MQYYVLNNGIFAINLSYERLSEAIVIRSSDLIYALTDYIKFTAGYSDYTLLSAPHNQN